MLDKSSKKSDYDACVYMKMVKKFDSFGWILLVLYVDDMLIACERKSDCENLKAMLAKEFSMKNLGQAKRILGMDIQWDRSWRRLWLSQETYMEKIFSKYGMENAKAISTPLAPHFKLSKEGCPQIAGEIKAMSEIPYDSIVSRLMYAMTCT